MMLSECCMTTFGVASGAMTMAMRNYITVTV